MVCRWICNSSRLPLWPVYASLQKYRIGSIFYYLSVLIRFFHINILYMNMKGHFDISLHFRKMLRLFFLLIISLDVVINQRYRGRSRQRNERKCEQVTIPICKQVGYNLTYMPNKFGHKTQFDAGLVIHQFWPLVTINCSPHLIHLVCSLYAPMCDPIFGKEIVPCRSFCKEVRDACEPVMAKNSFSWPDNLRCSKFPSRAENHICMKPDYLEETPKPTSQDDTLVTDRPNYVPTVDYKKPIFIFSPKKSVTSTSCGCLCQYPFTYANQSYGPDQLPPCVLQCNQYFFEEDEKKFMSFWIGLWSITSLVSTMISGLTFLVGRDNFSYIERPVFWVAFCYIMVSLGYIVRLIYGFKSVACNESNNLLRYSTTGPAQCTAVFMLTYFFSNVAWIWWVVLSMNWFLAAGLRWSTEAITSYAHYFHFIAWLIPTIQTMAILAMAAIDSDPVSGLCSVGNHDNDTLTIFVIAPLLIYAMLALSFLIAGFVAMIHYRYAMTKRGAICSKLNRLLIKIGIFSTGLLIPAVSLVVCHFYEQNNRKQWEKSSNCPCMKEKQSPKFYIYLFKYFMSLSVGVIVGLWIISNNVLSTWSDLFCQSSWSRPRNNNECQNKYQPPGSYKPAVPL